MDISVTRTNVLNLLEQPPRLHPEQRPYIWSADKAEQFLTQLADGLANGKPVSIGTIVLDNCQQLLDGQQRLITLALLAGRNTDDFMPLDDGLPRKCAESEWNREAVSKRLSASAHRLRDRLLTDDGHSLSPLIEADVVTLESEEMVADFLATAYAEPEKHTVAVSAWSDLMSFHFLYEVEKNGTSEERLQSISDFFREETDNPNNDSVFSYRDFLSGRDVFHNTGADYRAFVEFLQLVLAAPRTLFECYFDTDQESMMVQGLCFDIRNQRLLGLNDPTARFMGLPGAVRWTPMRPFDFARGLGFFDTIVIYRWLYDIFSSGSQSPSSDTATKDIAAYPDCVLGYPRLSEKDNEKDNEIDYLRPFLAKLTRVWPTVREQVTDLRTPTQFCIFALLMKIVWRFDADENSTTVTKILELLTAAGSVRTSNATPRLHNEIFRMDLKEVSDLIDMASSPEEVLSSYRLHIADHLASDKDGRFAELLKGDDHDEH